MRVTLGSRSMSDRFNTVLTSSLTSRDRTSLVRDSRRAQTPHMILGYLVNAYPAATHGSIRREIAAIESLGFVVRRYTIRNGVAVVLQGAIGNYRRRPIISE